MSVLAPKIRPELAAELLKLAQETQGNVWGPNGLFEELKSRSSSKAGPRDPSVGERAAA